MCARACPLGIIDEDDPALVGAGCLHCCACVKSCPEDAKRFSSESTDQVIAMLESKCLERKEPSCSGEPRPRASGADVGAACTHAASR
ncbi:MAG: hypothetical protein ACLR3C_13870 [Eggerthella lenta]